MSAQIAMKSWKDIRNGLIDEVEKIPAEQMSFRATPDTRSIAEILQHIVETQKILVGETCRENSNLLRQSFAAHGQEYAPGVSEVTDKQGLIDLLRSSTEAAEATVLSHADMWDAPMNGLTGQPTTKGAILTFASAHEMYHRGQLTVYERLLNIEPVLTGRLKKLFAASGSSD
jgi:uncharacterized damage-inducible protein DinB